MFVLPRRHPPSLARKDAEDSSPDLSEIAMKQQREGQSPVKAFLRDENGAVAIIMIAMLPVFVGFLTLAIDASHFYVVKNRLQTAAEAAALAGTQFVGLDTDTGGTSGSTPCASATAAQLGAGGKYYLCTAAQALASDNMPATRYGTVLQNADIAVGVWGSTGTFTPLALAADGYYPNAVQVTTRMTSANGNPVFSFFTPMLAMIANGGGFSTFNLTAKATAAFTSTNANGSQTNAVSDLIIVQVMSCSFTSSSCAANQLSNAQAAEENCAKDFALTGNENSKFSIVLFTGNSPQATIASRSWSNSTGSGTYTVPAADQGGWCPQNWSNACDPDTTKNYMNTSWPPSSSPFVPLTSPTSTDFLLNMDTDITNITNDVNTGTYAYSGSGSNISAGVQAAVNQFCPATGGTTSNGCLGGTVQIVVITDGVSKCSMTTSSSGFGTSTVVGQGRSNTGKDCSTQTTVPTGWSSSDPADALLLNNDYNLATYAGSMGITLSTIFYSGEGNGNTTGPDGLTYSAELEKLTTNANAALTTALGDNALQGQFFNEPTAGNLAADLQQICVGGANANKPRLVL